MSGAVVAAAVSGVGFGLFQTLWGPRVWFQDGAQVVELGGREIRSAVGLDVQR